MRPHHTKADRPKQPKQTDNSHIQGTKDSPVDLLVQLPRTEIGTEAGRKDSKVQSRVVVVDICDTAHGDEGKVVQEPTDDGIDPGVVDLVDVGGLEVFVAALPADEVPDYHKSEDTEGSGGAPVDNGVTKEEVLDDWTGMLAFRNCMKSVWKTDCHRSSRTCGDRHEGRAIATTWRLGRPACQGLGRARCWMSSWRR